MTREEAIAFFKDMNECTYGNLEAVEMTIKALEKEPCEDCISREKTLMALTGDITDCTIEEYIARLREKLNKLPPITPKEKMGHWIKYSIPRCGEQHYQCTSCGYYINFGQWGEVYTKQFKYCPNCSAKMEVSE